MAEVSKEEQRVKEIYLFQKKDNAECSSWFKKTVLNSHSFLGSYVSKARRRACQDSSKYIEQKQFPRASTRNKIMSIISPNA